MSSNKEPTFRLEIKTCQFNHLSMEDLTKKLRLMHDLNLRHFYTIVEDTNEEYSIKKD